MAKFVIIGAGLTGLSTAYHLEQAGCFDYVLLEKEQEVGGLCRSIQVNGFTFDFTGHLLHLNDQYARGVVNQVFPLENFAVIQRKSTIHSHGVQVQYPFQINLHGLPHDVIVDCIQEFIQRPQCDAPPSSFREWVLANFGLGLGKHFFFPYQEKIFDIPIDELSASWTGRFVPSTSLNEMLRGALGSPVENVGYNASFLYPHQGGIVAWVNGLSRSLKNQAYLEHEVVAIDGVRNIVRCANGHEEPFEKLITTMPLDLLLKQLKEKPHSSLAHAVPHLRCNSVISTNLGVTRPSLLDAHWVYYPEKTYPFYRIGFPSNLTPQMTPSGHSSLIGESAALNKSAEEIQTKKSTARQAIQQFFALADEEIAVDASMVIPHAYVIFDPWRDAHLQQILNTLAEEYQIESIGRYGAWKYSSMQEALLDGKTAAEKLLNR